MENTNNTLVLGIPPEQIARLVSLYVGQAKAEISSQPARAALPAPAKQLAETAPERVEPEETP